MPLHLFPARHLRFQARLPSPRPLALVYNFRGAAGRVEGLSPAQLSVMSGLSNGFRLFHPPKSGRWGGPCIIEPRVELPCQLPSCPGGIQFSWPTSWRDMVAKVGSEGRSHWPLLFQASPVAARAIQFILPSTIVQTTLLWQYLDTTIST